MGVGVGVVHHLVARVVEALTDSGYLSTQPPTTKKVAFTLYRPRMSMSSWVSSFPQGDVTLRRCFWRRSVKCEWYFALLCAIMKWNGIKRREMPGVRSRVPGMGSKNHIKLKNGRSHIDEHHHFRSARSVHTMAGEYLSQFQYPWEALDGIKEMILSLGSQLSPEEYSQPHEHVWVHKTAVVAPTAYLGAPCIIGPETEVRHCAFIRGSALVGAHCVVGNSVELKNVILFDNVQTPHYNYVGDSILGYKSHMGAGSSPPT